MQSTTVVANKMKDNIGQFVGFPPSRIDVQIEQLNKQIITQSVTITRFRNRNPELITQGENMMHTN
jgi:hypothetical protein